MKKFINRLLILWLVFLGTGYLYSAMPKSNGSTEITSDVIAPLASAMSNSNSYLDSVIGQAGGVNVWVQNNMELFSGFLSSLGSAPKLNFISYSQRTDGTGYIDVTVECTDPDNDNTRVKAQYSATGLAGSFVNASLIPPVTVTVGTTTPSLTSDEYQIGNVSAISTISTNTLTFVWDTKTDVANTEANVYANLTIDDWFMQYTIGSTLYLDNKNPVVYDLSDAGIITNTSIKLNFGAACDDSNFSEYKIFISTDASLDDTYPYYVSKATYSMLGYQNYNSTTSITIDNLINNTSYYFRIYAYDIYGNKSGSSVLGPIMTTALASANIALVSPLTDGTGLVNINVGVIDPNSYKVGLKVEYQLSSSGTWYTAYISTATQTFGTNLVVDSTATYQVQNVFTDSTTYNNLTLVWDTQNSLNGSGAITESDTVLVKITPNTIKHGDGIDDVSSPAITLDNLAPTIPSNFKIGDGSNIVTSTMIPVSWEKTTETRFSNYEIRYSTSSDMSSYYNVSYTNINTTTTVLTANIMSGSLYYIKLFAIDQYNNVSETVIISTRTQYVPLANFTSVPDQTIAGDGLVAINAEIIDKDLQESGVCMRVEYSQNSSAGPWTKATLDETVSLCISSAPYTGAVVDIDNSEYYQVGNNFGWISTSSGTHNLQFYWKSAVDLANTVDNDVYIRLIVFDGVNVTISPAVSTAFLVDNVKPIYSSPNASYDNSTGVLVIPFNEVISTFTATVGVSESITLTPTSSITDTRAFGVTETLLFTTTSYGLTCTLTQTHREQIASWQRQGLSLYFGVQAAAVKDIKGNANDLINPTQIINWNQDTSKPSLMSAVYDYDDNKLVLNFDEKMSLISFDRTNLRLQDDLGNYVNLSSSDTFVTTVDSSTITLSLTAGSSDDGTLYIVSGWPYKDDNSANGKKLFVAVSSATVCDISGNRINSSVIQSTYTYDNVIPIVTSYAPDPNKIGVYIDPVDAKIEIKFSEKMDSLSLLNTNAVTVKATRDNLCKTLDTTVAVVSTYDETDGFKLTVESTSSLKYNYTYKVTLHRDYAKDKSSNKIDKDITWEFSTIMNKDEDNVVENGNIRVFISAGFLLSNSYLDINSTPLTNPDYVDPNSITEAELKEKQKDIFSETVTSSIVEMTLNDKNGNNIGPALVSARQNAGSTGSTGTMDIELFYPDADNDGFLDGTYPKVRENTLRLNILDEDHNLFVRIPNAVIDTTLNKVTSVAPMFGTFALVGGADNDVSQAYAYPVPYKPTQGHTNITFTNLPSKGTIDIYTISGELVKSIEHNDGSYTYTWDVKSNAGNNVFSGVYIYVIKSSTGMKKGKLMIIR